MRWLLSKQSKRQSSLPSGSVKSSLLPYKGLEMKLSLILKQNVKRRSELRLLKKPPKRQSVLKSS